MALSIVILAAGQGTRMKSPTPKVLHTIGAKPMLSHVIETAKALSPEQIIVVHGFEGDKIRAHFEQDALLWAEQPSQLGTGDAVAKALPQIPADHRVLILYGDVPLICQDTLKRLLHKTPLDALGLLSVVLDDPFGLGRLIRDEKGEVKRIVEERDAIDAERAIKEVNTGIFLVSAKALHNWLPKLKQNNKQEEYYLTDIVAMAVNDDVSVVTTSPGSALEVQGVNDRRQQALVERHYQQRLANALLDKGVWVCDPARLDVRGDLQAEPGVYIDVNVVIEGRVTIKKGCHIGPNCVLIDCELDEGVTLLANSHCEKASIGKNTRIGPFARIRPGSVLHDSVHVGNFVEIKNATLGEGSKANHLSYIGDTLMGKNVNVGAGTITCNYDGVNKHQTVIEDGVHIGSDTQLIAPIHVGKEAVVAAGSTLTRDVPPAQLTKTHELKQRSTDWAKPVKIRKATSSDSKTS